MANAIGGLDVRDAVPVPKPGNVHVWLGALLATPLLWFAWWILALPAHVFNGTRLILYDQGSMLYAVERAVHGESLYSQFAWQYGPGALAWYEGWAWLLGNSPMTLAVASGVATGLAWVGWVSLAAKIMGRWTAWLGGSLLLLPAMTPSCWLGINDGPHSAVIALTLAGVAWAIYGACVRTQARCLVILGASLGLIQLVKFGPHAVAGVTSAALVILCAWRERGEKLFMAMWRTLGWMLAGFAVVELPLVATLALKLPWPLVKDQLWPQYMIEHYNATFDQRLPALGSWSQVVSLLLPIAIALALTAWLLFRKRSGTTGRGSAAAGYALAFSGLYFLVAFPLLMRSDYAVLAGLWLPLPALALTGRDFRWLRWTASLLVLPAAATNIGAMHANWEQERDWHASPLALPNGQLLWFRQREMVQFGTLNSLLEKGFAARPGRAAKKLAVFGAGGGVRYFFGTARVGRHWWYLAEFVRPWEQEQVLEDLARHDLLLSVVDLSAASPRTVSIWTPLRPDLAGIFLNRLRNPRVVPGIGYLMDIESAETGQARRP